MLYTRSIEFESEFLNSEAGEVETSSKNLSLAGVGHTKETLHIKYERKPVDIGFEYQRKEGRPEKPLSKSEFHSVSR